MVCSLFNCFYIILSSKLSIIKIIILHKKDEIIRFALFNCCCSRKKSTKEEVLYHVVYKVLLEVKTSPINMM